MEAEIFIIAMPLGNPEDLSPRAKKTLEKVELIFCEDTRKSHEIFKRAGVTTQAKLIALPSERERDFDFARALKSVKSAALISDAGTPIVNDPGLSLVHYARKNSLKVTALPGPSAPILAWQWHGGFGLPFSFLGFVPKAKAGAKDLTNFFAPAEQSSGTCCYFDTRYQAVETLKHLVQSPLAQQRLVLLREMTKAHEELVEGSPSEILRYLETLIAADQVGELSFLLEPLPVAKHIPLADLVKIRSAAPREAAKIAAQLTGESVRNCYESIINGK